MQPDRRAQEQSRSDGCHAAGKEPSPADSKNGRPKRIQRYRRDHVALRAGLDRALGCRPFSIKISLFLRCQEGFVLVSKTHRCLPAADSLENSRYRERRHRSQFGKRVRFRVTPALLLTTHTLSRESAVGFLRIATAGVWCAACGSWVFLGSLRSLGMRAGGVA